MIVKKFPSQHAQSETARRGTCVWQRSGLITTVTYQQRSVVVVQSIAKVFPSALASQESEATLFSITYRTSHLQRGAIQRSFTKG